MKAKEEQSGREEGRERGRIVIVIAILIVIGMLRKEALEKITCLNHLMLPLFLNLKKTHAATHSSLVDRRMQMKAAEALPWMELMF